MGEHPPLSDFERFVAGLSPAADDFEDHVAACGACARTLQREARVQLASEAAARELEPRSPGRSWRGPAYVMGAAVAIAASAFLFLRGVTAVAAESGRPASDAEDVHGQPVAVVQPDAGFAGGTFLASLDAGPTRARPCVTCEPRL